MNELAQKYSLKRPKTIKNITFGELKRCLKTVEHESFMVFDAATQEMLFKLKSPYYLISKFFGRSQADNLEQKLKNKRQLDEEFYPLVDYIHKHKQTFNQLTQLDKIKFIQAFLRKN